MPEFTSPPLVLLIVAALSYLLGSIPFGIVITRAMGLGDIRQIGSGNIGATNVLRTGNKLAAALTLILDAGKGAIAVIAARLMVGEDAAQIAGGFAFLGHLWPVWLGFRGGKGVATFLGTLLALAWPLGLLACATWAATAALTRISSLSALTAAALSPVYAVLMGQPQFVLLTIMLAGLIFVRHHANIRRLLVGTEPRIGKKSEG
jgi:glycerol-3-phosphate acyltransferase PlsY